MSRSVLLESTELQNFLNGTVRDQFDEATKYLDVRTSRLPKLMQDFRPECEALLEVMLLVPSFRRHNSSAGQKSMGVSYKNSRDFRTWAVITLMLVLPDYLGKRSDLFSSSRQDKGGKKRRIELTDVTLTLFSWLEEKGRYLWRALKFAKIANWLAFMQHGKYPNLWTRIFSIEQDVTAQQRNAASEIKSREMLWASYIELIGFIIPILQSKRIKFLWGSITRSLNLNQGQSLQQDSSSPREDDVKICPICQLLPIIHPSCSVCQHIFCHFCLSSALDQDEEYECVICRTKQCKEQLRLVQFK